MLLNILVFMNHPINALLITDSKFLKEAAIEEIAVVKEEAHMFPQEVADLLQQLRKAANKSPTGINFQKPDLLSEDGYYNLTGLTKDQFENLYITTKGYLGIEKGVGKKLYKRILETKSKLWQKLLVIFVRSSLP